MLISFNEHYRKVTLMSCHFFECVWMYNWLWAGVCVCWTCLLCLVSMKTFVLYCAEQGNERKKMWDYTATNWWKIKPATHNIVWMFALCASMFILVVVCPCGPAAGQRSEGHVTWNMLLTVNCIFMFDMTIMAGIALLNLHHRLVTHMYKVNGFTKFSNESNRV